MATKKVTYKEPSDYFSANMRKAVKEYDKKKAQAEKSSAAKKGKK